MPQNPTQDPIETATGDRIPALKAEIADMILSRGSVTFAELTRIDGFDGEYGHAIVKHDLNCEIVLWPHMSRPAAKALDDLLGEKVIAAKSCASMFYVIDGVVPAFDVLPASIERRTKPYAKMKTFWAPLQFSAYAKITEADRVPVRFNVTSNAEGV